MQAGRKAIMFRVLWAVSKDRSAAPASVILRQKLSSTGYHIWDLALDNGFSSDFEGPLNVIQDAQVDLAIFEPQTEDFFESIKLCSALKVRTETENIPIFFLLPPSAVTSQQKELDSRLRTCFTHGASDILFLSEETQAADFEEALLRIRSAIRDGRSAFQARALCEQITKMNTELYERNLQVEKELYTTRQLQQSLLPAFLSEPEFSDLGMSEQGSEIPRISKCHYNDEKLRISGLYLPCDALGGDFYDVIRFADGAVGVSLADVSGHGVPAAFITAIYKSVFYRITHNHSAANDILFHLNNELAEIVKTGDYVTALYMRLTMDENSLQVEYSGAGHPYPLHYSAKTKKLQHLSENATPLVWVKNMEYPLGHLTLEPEDKLLLFTDGVTEMRNAEGDFFGDEALETAFLQLLESNKPALLNELVTLLSDFAAGQALEDDISMVLIEAL
jgi:sigma-B regulation protein RsbU (phosphoserine phosphatase)